MPALQSRPLLNETELLYWDVYHDLHAGRQSNGFGPCPLSLGDCLAMADLYAVRSDDAKRDLVRIMRAMDRTYFEQLAKKNG